VHTWEPIFVAIAALTRHSYIYVDGGGRHGCRSKKIQTKFINKLAHHSLLAEQHVPLRISNRFDVILVLCAPTKSADPCKNKMKKEE
jgi:hypothetical protein